MKKTTVRFVGVGAVLLLSALALALAQHDARQSSDAELVIARPKGEKPLPIPVDDSPLWGNSFASSSTIVRANDDSMARPPSLNYTNSDDTAPPSPLPMASSENPLRAASASSDELTASSFEQFSESSVQLASGEGPPSGSPPELPSTMPAIPTQPIPALTPPTLAAPPASNDGVIRAPKPNWEGAPSIAPPKPALASPPAFPNSRPPVTQSLSDTQSPAMPATNLSNPPAGLQPSATPNIAAPIQPGLMPPAGLAPPAMPGQGSPASSLPGSANNNLGQSSRANSQLINTPLSNPPGALPSTPSAMSGASSGLPAPSARLGAPQPSANAPAMSGNASGSSSFGAVSDTGSRMPYAGTLLGRLISNQPGNRALLGSQNPVMLIQKRMAGECQVGKKATVIITVRNAGNSTAQDVEVIDSVPSGASFADAMPSVTPTPEGVLVWKLGEMGPNDERTITLQIIPERQGEMGSTAAVRFAAQASMVTLATLPKLELTFQSEPDVLIGGSHAIDVHVRNVGTGVARGVKLEADVPKNLRHETGDTVLEAPFGDIAPGESKRIRLQTIAAEPGAANVALRALTEDGVQQEQTAELRVLAPALEAVITGPNRRYLDRQATFQIMIKNNGTATATNCEFTMRLPSGLNFNGASSHGEYKATEHAVMWSVPEWPAGYSEAIELTVLPVEIGAQQMIFQGAADLGVKLEARGGVTVEEQGELTFTIDQDADPIELSSSTTYTIEVRNVGRPDRNVELSLQLPPGSEVLKVDAPVQARVEGDQLRFDPIPQMEGRTAQKFRVEVRHGKVGTQKVSAQLRSQNRPTLVIKEEATEVYNDRD